MKSSLQSQAYQAIRKQIIYADLEPGRKISEKALEEHLAIGRTPIREALIQLRQQELVYTCLLYTSDAADDIRDSTNTNSARNDFRRTRKSSQNK